MRLIILISGEIYIPKTYIVMLFGNNAKNIQTLIKYPRTHKITNTYKIRNHQNNSNTRTAFSSGILPTFIYK